MLAIDVIFRDIPDLLLLQTDGQTLASVSSDERFSTAFYLILTGILCDILCEFYVIWNIYT